MSHVTVWAINLVPATQKIPLSMRFFRDAMSKCSRQSSRGESRLPDPARQLGRNALAGLSVPERNGLAFCPAPTQHILKRYPDLVRIVADEPAGAERDRDRPFGVLPQSQAWNTQGCGLFLQPS